MKTISVLTLVLLTSHLAFGQIEAKMIDFNNKLEISLKKETSSRSFEDRIYSVNVIDAREDTGALGYYYLTREVAFKYGIKRGHSEKDKDIDAWSKVYSCSPTLKDGLTTWINNYLQCQKNDSVKNGLLIVVKKLWLSPEADEIHFDNDKIGQPMNGWDAGVVCKFEIYLERDSVFYPLYRIDSVFSYKDKLYDYAEIKFIDNSGLLISSTLKKILDNLGSINPDEIIAKRRKVLFKDIYNEYSKKAKVPMLNEAVFKKGVYANFEEFKTNSPSLKEYELRDSKMGDILYVKDGNSEYPTRNVWGFSDGINLFINSGDKYSKLVRKQNTFYFFGVKAVTKKSKYVYFGSPGKTYETSTGDKKTLYKMEYKYYQLDMETGEVY